MHNLSKYLENIRSQKVSDETEKETVNKSVEIKELEKPVKSSEVIKSNKVEVPSLDKNFKNLGIESINKPKIKIPMLPLLVKRL